MQLTLEQIFTQFETIIDDTVDPVYETQLANLAKLQIESLRPWMYLLRSWRSTTGSRSIGALSGPSAQDTV